MSLISIPASAWERGLEPKEIVWHGAVHILGAAGFVWMLIAFHSNTLWLMIALFLCGHLSIRTGVHSLYTHQAYEASFWWHCYKVVGFMLTMQGPLRIWAALHICHHKYTDTDKDPYSPIHGGLWSHMLWRFFNLPKINFMREVIWLYRKRMPEEARLERLLKWQEKHFWSVGLLLTVGIPTIIASLWGDPIGGFLLSFTRLMLQYHHTWQINSISHMVGLKPYTDDSSRDAPWWLVWYTGLTSVGEATRHNRHHRFPRDFRIGNRWYDLEMGKWEMYSAWGFSQLLKALDLPPLVWNLHRYDDDGTLQLLV